MSEQQQKAQREALEFVKKHNVEAELNTIINKVGVQKPEDVFGFIVRELRALSAKPTVARLVGREVLDSRGNPTVETDVYAKWNAEERFVAREAGPSGASTGSNEALELRDKDEKRFLGKGVSKAAANVTQQLSAAVAGMPLEDQQALDDALCKADGTPLKTNLGGNAITATSFALAQAGAQAVDKELYRHLSAVFYNHADGSGNDEEAKKEDSKVPAFGDLKMPRPMVNILNGGKHAGGNLKIQEFMIIPRGDVTFKEMVRYVTEVYHHLSKILVKKYGKSAKNLGDEGGFAPALEDPEEALTLLEEAIVAAGYKVNEDIFLALDCAASEFYNKDDGKYELQPGKWLTSDEMVDFYVKLVKDHPALISIEDGLDEKDYAGWIKMMAKFREEFGERVMLVGDDLLTTNTTYIQKSVAEKWCNALLLKVNQIGTVSEAMAAARMMYKDNCNVIVSHRSGETPGAFIADLAVGIQAQFIKTGATARGERIAKYNRLLQIEEHIQANKQ
eukprot:TRINITY_DN54516_c0_g1_i1.p1 TRINITY_DN54516_c0_g1~~TRINITY_DN54516_c0_g1_i1.p1  ORF type:complete len:506 (-),score=366.71 TRINITY_DN54516_c0_g1_i1:121-1638(-)